MELFVNHWKIFPSENKIRYSGEEISLQPLCMSLLLFLCNKPGEVIDRQEIIDQVWQGRIVSEDALNNSIRKLRHALNDNPKNPQLIETINKKGYRLIATVGNSKPRSWTNFYSSKIVFVSIFMVSISVLAWQSFSFDLVTIRPDMSDGEKNMLYQSIRDKTNSGGHIIKFEQTKD